MQIMDYVQVVLVSVGSLLALFLLTKLMGNKQMSQLTMFDYICGITIGSIAAEMATNLEEFQKPLTAMIVYTIFSVLISYLDQESVFLRRILTGRAVVLLEGDKLYERNMRKAKIDVHEFLMLCRNSGFFDVSELQSAILESNGKISFLPKAKYRPVCPDDMKLSVERDIVVSTLIVDGKILYQNLKYSGKNEEWLKKQMEANGIHHASAVLLAICGANNQLHIYKKEEKAKADILQ